MAQLTLEGLIGATDEVTTSFVAQVFPDLQELASSRVPDCRCLLGSARVHDLQRPSHQVLGSGAKDVPHRHGALTLNWSTGGLVFYQAWGGFTESIAAKIMSGGVNSTSMLDALYVNVGKVASVLMNVSWRQFAMTRGGKQVWWLLTAFCSWSRS